MTNDGQGAAAPRLNETLKAALEQRFGERFSVSHGVREHHGRDESIYPLSLSYRDILGLIANLRVLSVAL